MLNNRRLVNLTTLDCFFFTIIGEEVFIKTGSWTKPCKVLETTGITSIFTAYSDLKLL